MHARARARVQTHTHVHVRKHPRARARAQTPTHTARVHAQADLVVYVLDASRGTVTAQDKAAFRKLLDLPTQVGHGTDPQP